MPIPQLLVKLFTDLCPHCLETRKVRKHQKAGHKPILSKQYGERGQADLVDYQAMEFEGFKYLLVYQDHCTKLVNCAPLRDKIKRTVALALLKMFTLLGAPRILHTDNGTEFSELANVAGDMPKTINFDLHEVIEDLKSLWPGCFIVHGRPRHSPSQGSVERANRKFREHIRSWLLTNKNNECRNDWPTAAMFANFSINTAFHRGLKQTPYKLVFGQNPICGIRDLPLLSDELAMSLRTEAELIAFYEGVEGVSYELSESEEKMSVNSDEECPREQPGTPAKDFDETPADTCLKCKKKFYTAFAEPGVSFCAGTLMCAEAASTNSNSIKSGLRNEQQADSLEIEPPNAEDLDENSSLMQTVSEDENLRAVIKFCKECKRRQYPSGTRPSSTHLSTGGEEAVCDCIEKSANEIEPPNAEDLDENSSLMQAVSEDENQFLSEKPPNEDERDQLIIDDELLDKIDVSPRRNELRRSARMSMRKQAKEMMKAAAKSQGVQGDLIPGTICKINMSDFDRISADATTLTAVIVERTKRGLYRLACKGGVLGRCYERSYIVVIPDATVDLVDLKNEFEKWRELRTITLRAAAKVKAVALNLRIRCNCRGNCDTMRCSCKKNGLVCKSSCHRNNTFCCNRQKDIC